MNYVSKSSMAAIALPVWLRIVVVAGLIALATGVGFFTYRWYTRPVTLSIAAGSLDGEAPKLLSALARQIVATNAPVRLKVVETTSAAESAKLFAAGKTDLAVVRGDVGDLSQAQAVIVVAQAVVMLIAPPGSSITGISDLKRMTVGVVGGESNRKIASVLTKSYDLERANVVFKEIAPAAVRRALETKEVRVLLLVLPLTEKYLALVRGLFPQNAKTAPILIPIENAGAIAEEDRAYESFDIPKGTLRGSPPVPEEDVTTLRVSLFLVAKKSLDNDLVATLTQSLMNAHRDLLREEPILAQVKALDTDPGSYLPVHPGAAEFYNGTQQGFLDKWSNVIFLAPMALGAVATLLASAWKFLRSGDPQTKDAALDALYALGRRIRTAETESDLSEIEQQIDEVLRAQRGRAATEDENGLDAATLNVAAHRLENLIHDRRLALAAPLSEPRPKSGS